MVSPCLAARRRREAAAALRGIHARLWLLFPGGGGDAQHSAAYVRLLRGLPRAGEKVDRAPLLRLTRMWLAHQRSAGHTWRRPR